MKGQNFKWIYLLVILLVIVMAVFYYQGKVKVTAYQRPAPSEGYGDIDGDGYVSIFNTLNGSDNYLLLAFFDEYGPWDVNGDGIVNEADLAEVAQYWEWSGLPYEIRADAFPDGYVDAMDMLVVNNYYNQTTTPPMSQERINQINIYANIPFTPDEIIRRGDVNGNGILDIDDVRLIIKYAKGEISKFPVESVENKTIEFKCPDNLEGRCDGYVHTYDLGGSYHVTTILVDAQVHLPIEWATDILYLKVSSDGNSWDTVMQWVVSASHNHVFSSALVNKEIRYVRYEMANKIANFVSSGGYAQVVAGGLPPVAQLDKTVYYATSGDTVTFDASASYDPDGYIVWYRYVIKKGSKIIADEGWTKSSTYSFLFISYKDETYTITLTVVDNDNLMSNTTATIYVKGVNNPPELVLAQNEYHINKLPATITFDASNSYDPDGGQLQFRWEVFGFYDTGWGDYPTFTYTFDEGWAFTDVWYVYVYVRDDAGGTDSGIITVYFNVPVTVNINLTWTPEQPYVGDTVVFDASGSYVEGVNMTITDYAFVIDGNFYGWYKTPYKRYTFKFAGYHTVEVRVMLNGNRIISGGNNVWNVYISPYYDTEAIIVSGDMVSGKPVYVQVVSPNLIKKVEVWFGDGSYDSKDDVSAVSCTFTHTYAISGVYTVNAKIYDYNDNVVTVSKSIRIYSPEDFEEKEKIPAWVIVAGIAVAVGIIGYVAYRRWKR